MSRRKLQVVTESPDADKVWRSLDEKHEAPEARAQRAEAEPPAAAGSILDAALGRRGFLGLTSATAAAVALEGCVRRPAENILPYSQAPEHVVPGVPMHFATVTERRGEAIGLLVTSHAGRPTKVEGNPSHPASGGAADVFAQAAVLDLYDPDRSKLPARREGDGLVDAADGSHAAYSAFDEALAERIESHAADRGRGLRILARPTNSPSFIRAREAVKTRFPEAKVHTYAPVNESNAREGARLAFGRPLSVQADYSRAKVILALDSDFLQLEAGAVRAARQFAAGRSLESASDDMSRLYVVEPGHSVTGAAADHRLRLPARDVDNYLRALCAAVLSDSAVLADVGRRGMDLGDVISALGSPSTDQLPEKWVAEVARELISNRGQSVVVTGARQPAAVHALVHVLNLALGNVGATIALTPVADSDEPEQIGEIKTLSDDMKAGRVRTLLILGGNPVYEAPSDVAFAEALAEVELSVHLSGFRDETSSVCTWHVPRAHELETWGDQRAMDGTWSVQQPLIAPLWGGRSDIELLALVAGIRNWRGHPMVRATLREQAGRAGFERTFRSALHAGVVANTAHLPNAGLALVPAAIGRALRDASPSARPLGADNMEVVFAPCTKLFDGRHANNAWLLELPESMTKICWDNAALISPATAREIGLANRDMVRLSREGASPIDVPVFVLPGHADYTISLSLGWGRGTEAGRYGAGHGFDVGPLRTTSGFWFADGVSIEKLGREHMIAQTQEHDTMHGRPIVLDATLEEYRAQPNFPSYRAVEMDQGPLWETVDYSSGHRWGMVIDLSNCTGCNACIIACQAENNIPAVGKHHTFRGREMSWLRLDRYFVGDDEDDPQVSMQPIGCQHCEEAPCENVCPVNATSHTPEGLNDMAYNRCIGTRYCANNCPYKVRRFNYLSFHQYLDDPQGNYEDIPATRQMQYNPNVTVRMRGVMEKCSYCVQRIQEAKIAGRRDGRELSDGDVVSACAQTCPTGAIAFGDLNDSSSRVARFAERDRNYKLLVEVGARPRTSFLGRVRNPNPEMVG